MFCSPRNLRQLFRPNTARHSSTRFLDFLLVLGLFYTATNPLTRGQSPGDLDLSFGTTDTLGGAGTSIVTQPDGKVLVFGNFSSGQGKQISSLVRLNQDGSLDPTWLMTSAILIQRLALQADGKVIVVGSFLNINNAFRPYVARLNTNGLVDSTFHTPPYTAESAGKFLLGVAVRPDGKIYVAGKFNSYFGHPTVNLALLNSDGTVDTNFTSNINYSSSSPLQSVVLGNNGTSILIASAGISFGDGSPANLRRHIARLDSNTGALDTGFVFDSGGIVVGGAGNNLEVLPDGKILLGGAQGAGADSPYSGMLRLLPNGTLDTSFKAGPTLSHLNPADPFWT